MIITPSIFGEQNTSTAVEDIIFTGRSVANQIPTGQDQPINVEFGAAQGGVADPARLTSTGEVIINQAGTYNFNILLSGSRTGASGVSNIFARLLVNGTQVGGSLHAKLNDEKSAYPFFFNISLPLPTGAVVTVQFYRDSIGSNFGELSATTPTLLDWNTASSAVLTLSRLVPVSTDSPVVIPVRSNRVLVKSKDDFPLPVNGVITLEENVDYEINGFISLVGDYIKGNGSNTIYGLNPELDILYTNNPTALFYGRDSGFILNNFTPVNAGGGIFDVECTEGNEGTQSLFISRCVLTSSPSLGRVKNLLVTHFEKNALRSLATGLLTEGSGNVAARITGNVFEETAGGTVLDLGTSVFNAISIDHNFIQASTGLVVLSGEPNSGNISASGQGVIQSNTTFGGNLPNIIGVSYKDSRWNWGLNNNVPDSASIGSLYMEDNTVPTVFSGANTPTKALGATLAGDNIQRFVMTDNNRLRYIGNKFYDAVATYSVSVRRVSGSGSRLIKFTIYKNGVPLTGASQVAEVNTREVNIVILGNPSIQPNDEFELWVENTENTNAIQITQMQCSIT